MNYNPALILLDRTDPLGLPWWVGLLSPLVALAVGLAARIAWHFGIRQYQSTGT